MLSRAEAAAQISDIEAAAALDLAEIRRHNRAVEEYTKALEAQKQASAIYLQALDSMRRAPVVSLSEWGEVAKRHAACAMMIRQIQASKMGAESAAEKTQQRLQVAQRRLRDLRAIVEAQAVVYDLVAARAAASRRGGA